MPHCIIEYSKELIDEINLKDLMSAVFQGAVDSSLFSAADIKIRAIPYHDFYAEGASKFSQQRFIHICCKILSGRTLVQRQKLSQLILQHAVNFGIDSISISVEIVDMERESYNKKLS